MNDQDFAFRVGELATRIGYSIPSIDWTADKKYCARGIMLDPNGAFGETLHVYRGVEQSMPVHVQDFLIAQEFTQARLGAWRQRRRLQWAMTALAIVLGFVAVGRAVRWTDSYFVGFLVGCTGAYLVWAGVRLVVSAVWSRWMTRRCDPRLVELLGRDEVMSALRWWVDSGWRPSVRWLLGGAVPTPAERLRRLGTSVTD